MRLIDQPENPLNQHHLSPPTRQPPLNTNLGGMAFDFQLLTVPHNGHAWINANQSQLSNYPSLVREEKFTKSPDYAHNTVPCWHKPYCA